MREYRSTVRLKPDLKITVQAGADRLTIGAVLLPDGKLHIKSGRYWSEKLPVATLSRVFAEGRKWATRKIRRLK
jgi:hypothetical protein